MSISPTDIRRKVVVMDVVIPVRLMILSDPDNVLRVGMCPLEATNMSLRNKLRYIAHNCNDIWFMNSFFTLNALLAYAYG